MNNLCEAFNSTILVARDKPLLTMCDLIRKYVMRRFANLREKVDRIQGNAMPKPKMRLEFAAEVEEVCCRCLQHKLQAAQLL